MANSTSITYRLKRKILTFTNKASQKRNPSLCFHFLSPDCEKDDPFCPCCPDWWKWCCKAGRKTLWRFRHCQGWVREHPDKNVYKKGYHVTEACALTATKHPVSIFSRIHSSAEKGYKSVNTITFDAIRQAAALFGKATFVMDRGYDDNKIFLMLDRLKQDHVIRLKSNRKLLYHRKWTMATELRNRRKGKIKTDVFYNLPLFFLSQQSAYSTR